MSPIDERHFGSQHLSHRHGGVGKAVSAASGNAIARKRGGEEWGGDRDVRGTAQWKCIGETPLHESERVHRSGSGVVKRQIPWSFDCGYKPKIQGRGVSLGETPGAHEARVLVVEAVGSRSRSVRIGIGLHGAPQGKLEKGDLAQGKSSNPLTRAATAQK